VDSAVIIPYSDPTLQDCAGAILYSTDKAIEISLEAMQCLGGNGYINGSEITSPLTTWFTELILQSTLLDGIFAMLDYMLLVLVLKRYAGC
jgi:alkylation response protein AidB-like acyl-CoA dehydrogenase